MKKRTMRTMITALLAAVLCLGLVACSGEDFDAAGYVKSVLDANYHKEYKGYATFRQLSEEEAEKEIVDSINLQLELEIATVGGITEDGKERYKELSAEIDKLAKYEVTEAKKRDDGSYIVTVSVEPSNVFQIMEQVLTDVANEMMGQGATLESDEEFTEYLLEGMRRCIDQNAYGEAQTVEVAVSADDSGAYGISEEDMQLLQDTMFPE